ncbi:MAG: sporulation transcriptional regulator SpoIIID [Clostridia bacterium]|nr:sporulation transcriptional regulator SpoIIID [Clostridia bacterium]
MSKDIEKRVYLEAKYFIKHKSTVRGMTNVFGVSKSTIHYDLSVRLKKISFSLFKKVDKILKYNLSQRHIRGGIATKNKYKK